MWHVPPPQINFVNIIENLLIEQQAVYLLFQLSFSITVCVQIVYKQIGFAWGGGKKNDILMQIRLKGIPYLPPYPSSSLAYPHDISCVTPLNVKPPSASHQRAFDRNLVALLGAAAWPYPVLLEQAGLIPHYELLAFLECLQGVMLSRTHRRS